jgi:hypothetical protein
LLKVNIALLTLIDVNHDFKKIEQGFQDDGLLTGTSFPCLHESPQEMAVRRDGQAKEGCQYKDRE